MHVIVYAAADRRTRIIILISCSGGIIGATDLNEKIITRIMLLKNCYLAPSVSDLSIIFFHLRNRIPYEFAFTVCAANLFVNLSTRTRPEEIIFPRERERECSPRFSCNFSRNRLQKKKKEKKRLTLDERKGGSNERGR